MRVLNNEIKRVEYTGKVTVELTPEELATVTAAMATTSQLKVDKSYTVRKQHVGNLLTVFEHFNDLYKETFKEDLR